jgi:hypothetical protein
LRLLIFGLLLLSSVGCANQMLLFPTTYPIPVDHGARRKVPLSENRTVDVWTARASDAEPKAFVLRFCGNGERAEYALPTELEEWAGLPVEIWAVNYPGFGASTGPATLAGVPAAAVAVFGHVRAQHPQSPILVSGFSMGTTAALYLAANRPVAGLLLRSPPPLRQLIMGRYGWWNLWLLAGPVALQVPAQLDSIANAKQCNVPAVFLITARDTVIPADYQRKVAGAYAGPKQVVTAAEGNHNDPLTRSSQRAIRAQIEWLWTSTIH